MNDFRPASLLNAVLFAAAALLVFLAAFAVANRIAGGRLWRAPLQEKDVAAAILAGTLAIAIATIVAAAFH